MIGSAGTYTHRAISPRASRAGADGDRSNSRPTGARLPPRVDVLIALDQEAIDNSLTDLSAGSYLVADEEFGPKMPEAAGTLLTLPLTRIAKECHSPLLRNTVALGATAALTGLDLETFRELTRAQFEGKSRSIVDANIRALDAGAVAVGERSDVLLGPLVDGQREPHVVISGNVGVALGALAAGCRVMAGYPITPAYEIMDALVPLMSEFGGVVMQMEDEIAALAVCIGAGFTGVRALTATSGPGLSLMQENLGLAVMMEIPLVVVDVQRAGPSSGMATRHEQSDILSMICGTHGGCSAGRPRARRTG